MPEEKEFYDLVGKNRGWSFTDLKVVSDPTPFDYFEVLARKVGPLTKWLDLGCGSCSGLEKLIPRCKAFVGVDQSPFMIAKAREALAGCSNVTFHVGDTMTMHLNSLFTLITARHAPFDPRTAVRLLEEGGTFVTQQVEIDDKQALKDAFGRGIGYGETQRLSSRYAAAFQELGMEVEVRSYNVKEFYETADDLLFLLQNTPIVPNFGNVAGDREKFLGYVKENQTEKGIRATSSRSLIIVTKGENL